MSPEILLNYNNIVNEIEFNPEKSDLFSLGITYLRLILLLTQNLLFDLNDSNGNLSIC